MKALRFFIPLAGFVLLALLLYSGIGKDPHYVAKSTVDKPVPDFALTTLADAGVTVTKAQLLGKPYLLNVFGSWCVACQQEHQYLRRYARNGRVPIIGVNWNDTREDATRWLAQFGNPYSQVLVDETGHMVIELGVTGAPESFLVDPQGVIRYKYIGPLTDEVFAREIDPRVAAMTGATAPAATAATATGGGK